MASGGKRPGAGRKKGARNQRSRLIADLARSEGVTPLEVMLSTMRDLWGQGLKIQASAIAKDAAPFVHPRLVATQVSGPGGGPVQVDHITKEQRDAAFQAAMRADG